MDVLGTLRFLINESVRFISPPPIALEWLITGAAALVVALMPSRSRGLLVRARNGLRRLAGSRRGAILVCGLLPVVVRLALLGVIPIPVPSIHDEFSHLLLADTLAHGRLTNPTHPMWMHFETIHEIQRPTYNSMYPPGPASLLALGQVVFHEPWAGVLIGVGIMCAAICWMMQGWLPPAWAFYGSLIVVLKIGIVGFWMNSYLTGAFPAIGGALLIGALPRLKRIDSRPFDSIVAGIGMVMLMNSRPFEGTLLSLAAIVYLFPALVWRIRKNFGRVLRVVVLPAGLLVAAGVVFTGYYCWRVTGSPTRMPYQVNRDTYGWPENLAFLPAKKIHLRHRLIEEMYLKEIRHREIYKTAEGLFDNLATRLFDNWTFFFGPVLSIPLLFFPLVAMDRRTRALAVFMGLIVALNLLQMVLYPYHLGPIVPVMFAIVAQGARHLYVSLKRLSPLRALAFAAMLPVCLVTVGAMKQTEGLGLPLAYWERAAEPHGAPRAEIEDWLKARPHPQLVIVRYAHWHSPDQEWVYNHADIDGSKVVWARQMGQEADDQLVHYFSGREAWVLDVDQFPVHVVPYGRPTPAAWACTAP